MSLVRIPLEDGVNFSPFPFTPTEDAIIAGPDFDERAIADRIFAPVDEVRKRRAALGCGRVVKPSKSRRITADEISRAFALREAGLSYHRIGIKLGRESGSIRKAMVRELKA